MQNSLYINNWIERRNETQNFANEPAGEIFLKDVKLNNYDKPEQ